MGNSVKCLMTPHEIKLTNEIERLNKIIADLQNKQDDESVEDLDSEKTIDEPLLLFTTALTPVPAVVEEMKVIDDAFTNALNKVNTNKRKGINQQIGIGGPLFSDYIYQYALLIT